MKNYLNVNGWRLSGKDAKKRRAKFRRQRITRGFSDWDWWDLDYFLCNKTAAKMIKNCEIDLELKFSKKFIDIDAYSWVIASMIYFCDLYEALLLEKKITFTNAPLTLEKPYIESVNKIANQVSQEQRESFVFYLMNFLNAKDSINEEETMKQIKQHCKID